jgi:hypothetical protein
VSASVCCLALDYPLNSAYTSPYMQKALDRKLTNTSEIGTGTEMEIMEWRECYLDVILVPLGVLINIGYHAWLCHKVQTQPLTTAIGTYTVAQCLWVPAIMKVCDWCTNFKLSAHMVSQRRHSMTLFTGVKGNSYSW